MHRKYLHPVVVGQERLKAPSSIACHPNLRRSINEFLEQLANEGGGGNYTAKRLIIICKFHHKFIYPVECFINCWLNNTSHVERKLRRQRKVGAKKWPRTSTYTMRIGLHSYDVHCPLCVSVWIAVSAVFEMRILTYTCVNIRHQLLKSCAN